MYVFKNNVPSFRKDNISKDIKDPHWLTTFKEVLVPGPDCHHREIIAWSLAGFSSGPLPVLHSF